MREKHTLVFVTFMSVLVISTTKTTHTIQVAGTSVPERSMYDHCHGGQNQQQLVDKSVKVTLKSEAKEILGREVDCSVTYAARHSDEQLLISFESLAISCENNHRSERLDIYDGDDDQLGLTDSGGICGFYRRNNDDSTNGYSDYVYRTKFYSSITLKYWGVPTSKYDGFSAIITVTRDPFKNGTCGRESFMCKTNYCIPEELQCNGYVNCGDGSDEEKCVILPDHTGFQPNPDAENIGMLIGGSVSILIMMIVAVWLGIVCVKRMITKRECERRQNMLPAGPVIDADHVPPFIPHNQVSTRPRPPPLQSMLDSPPLYSDISHDRLHPYELPPPPYTPDGCDTAGLLNQTQGLSLDTPPAYRTIDPQFPQVRDDRHLHTYVFPLVDGVDNSIVPVHNIQHQPEVARVSQQQQELLVPTIISQQPLVPTPATNMNNALKPDTGPQLVTSACQVGDSIDTVNRFLPQSITAIGDTTDDGNILMRGESPERFDYVGTAMEMQPPEGFNEHANDINNETLDNIARSGNSQEDSLDSKPVHFYRKKVAKPTEN